MGMNYEHIFKFILTSFVFLIRTVTDLLCYIFDICYLCSYLSTLEFFVSRKMTFLIYELSTGILCRKKQQSMFQEWKMPLAYSSASSRSHLAQLKHFTVPLSLFLTHIYLDLITMWWLDVWKFVPVCVSITANVGFPRKYNFSESEVMWRDYDSKCLRPWTTCRQLNL